MERRYKIRWRKEGADRICDLHVAAHLNAPYNFEAEVARCPQGKLTLAARRSFWLAARRSLASVPEGERERLAAYIARTVPEPPATPTLEPLPPPRPPRLRRRRTLFSEMLKDAMGDGDEK